MPFKKGNVPYNKGLKNPELSKRQKENNVAKRPEVRIKMSEARKRFFANGGHNWNYIDGSSKSRFYMLEEWIKIAKEVYKRDNYTCQICGKKGGTLNAHHKIPYSISKDNSLINLITLCVSCHAKIHNNFREINKERKIKAQEVRIK
jgi:predicted HNH restriction endonuclease